MTMPPEKLASEGKVLRTLLSDWDGPVIRLVQAAEVAESPHTSSNPFRWSIIEQGLWIAILQGEMILRTPGQTFRLRAGEALAVVQPIQATFSHVRGATDVKIAYISFQGEFGVSFVRYLARRFGVVQPFDPKGKPLSRLRRICRLLKEDPKRDARFWSGESFQFLNEWWAEAEQLSTTARPTLDMGASSQIAVLHGGSVKQLASGLGYSYSHVARKLKRVLRTQPGKHLRRLRLEEGARLLRSTDLPIQEIATKIGFSGATAFGFAFRKVYHESPSQYRHSGPRAPTFALLKQAEQEAHESRGEN